MELQGELRRLSGTTLDAAGAANAWAGTTNLELVGALNAKAGTTGIELAGVLNRLAGTTGLGVNAAAALISGAAPAFSPADITGLKAWYKADGTLWQDSARTTPATADTNPVGSWDDASGQNNHVLNATAGERPAYRTAVLNGKPVLRFDGSDDFLSMTGALLAQPNTIIGVAKWVSGFVAMVDGNSTSERNALMVDAGGNYAYAAGGGPNGGAANTSWHIWSCVFNDASSILRIDGVSKATASPGTQSLRLMRIGAYSGGGYTWNGDIAEVLVYDGALTDAQLNQLGTYLNTKYGISWTTI